MRNQSENNDKNLYIKVVLSDLRLSRNNVVFVLSENELIMHICPLLGITIVYNIIG